MILTATHRIGPDPTKELLQPRYYECGGSRVRVTLVPLALGCTTRDTVATWQYSGAEIVSASEVGDHEQIALAGAMRTLGLAGERELNLWPERPPKPDLRITRHHEEWFLEVTQVRMQADMFASLREVQSAVSAAVDGSSELAAVFQGRYHAITCARGVPRALISEVVLRFKQWALEADWSGREDVYVTDPWLAKYIVVVSRRVVTFGRRPHALVGVGALGNNQQHDYVEAVRAAIEGKKQKTYEVTGPLWLSVTATEPFNALMQQVVLLDVELGQFTRILVADDQDVVVFERLAAEADVSV